MKFKTLELLRTGLKALPVITTIGGVAVAFVLSELVELKFESLGFGQVSECHGEVPC
jgi:hypothetical protein